MEKNVRTRAINPREKANFLSAIFFKWIFKIFFTGYKRELAEEDLYSPLDEHSSNFLSNKIYDLWDKEQERCQKLNVKSMPSLFKVLIKCFAFDIIFFGFFTAILELGIRTTQPLIFANLLKYFSGDQSPKQREAIYWATALVVGLFLNCIFFHSICQGLTHLGMKVRLACCSLIYRKILQVSQVSSEGQASVGQMINFLKNQANRLDKSFLVLHYIWVTPVQIILISYLLYREINFFAAGVVICLLLFIPIYGGYGKLISNFLFKLVRKTDERLKLTNNIVNNIRFLKMYAWEEPFLKLIDKSREKEMEVLKNITAATQFFLCLKAVIPKICLLATIFLLIFYGSNISAANIYLLIAYCYVLQSVLCHNFPTSIQDLVEFSTIINRIKDFLLLEEIEEKSITSSHNIDCKLRNIALSLESVSAKWDRKTKSETLKDVSFDVTIGNLTAIAGPSGAGKSSVFQAILNELPSIAGKIKVNGKISYASQQPWIFSSSIKENIVFGSAVNRARYERVICVCQLKRDFLLLLPSGEETLVGEKGMNLSASQRARIHLARAIYREADIYLLDDPLSSLDAQVGRAVRTFLRGKTVLLATHQLQYMKYADRVILLEAGRVRAEGRYEELLDSGFDSSELGWRGGTKAFQETQEITAVLLGNSYRRARQQQERGSSHQLQPFSEGDQERLENRQFESITAKSYRRYFGAANKPCLVVFVFAIAACCQVLSTAADWLLARWLNREEDGIRSEDRNWLVYAYAGMIGLFAIFIIGQNVCFYNLCARISEAVHARVLAGVAYTTMDFFNSYPAGRILNRFSKDMGTIDTRIPETLSDVIRIGMCVLAANVIVVSINPWLIIPAVITFLISYFLRLFYIKTIRSLRRLESMSRSSILSHLCTSVQGLATIRALNAEKIVTRELNKQQDLHSSAWYLLFSCSRALGLYVELCSLVFSAVVVYSLLLSRDPPAAGYVGLAISQCILLVSVAQWGVRQSSELTGQMISLERLLDYAKLPPEQEEEDLGNSTRGRAIPPAGWPCLGRLVFENVSLAYERRDRPSLRSLSLGLEPGERLAVIAGGGRSEPDNPALLDALLRLAAGLEGTVRIDGLASAELGLRLLRSGIGVLPREPALLPGTLRDNLDPFRLWPDRGLWQALEDVGLKFALQPNLGLDARMLPEVAERLDVCQRRLLCLARVLLRGNRILVVDENGIDARADVIVREVVRRKFAGCTVIFIAQRLANVMDCDKILVMDSGEVVEFDHPFKLLQRKSGVFYNMVYQLGSSTSMNLFEIAKFNYNKETAHL